QYPEYFTFHETTDYTKDQTIRHIEPAMAYQLEIHVYYAVGKENTSECRFFIRSFVRPGRLRNSMCAADYLILESDRLLYEILDFMEI
ncbi:639_t:CDS:2, partial [Funneliformis geosporum]